MYLKENDMMERRVFLNKIVRWGTVVILAGITLLLRRKIVTGKIVPPARSMQVVRELTVVQLNLLESS